MSPLALEHHLSHWNRAATATRNCNQIYSLFNGFARRNNSSSTPSPPPAKPRVVFSGIQPTGVPHIGNYLGALKPWHRLQQTSSPSDELFFSIVGLHAITVPQDPEKLRADRRDLLATLLAIGLDPKRCTIFHQEQVPQHSELAWILNCSTSMGRLNRMTTWKSKLATIRNASSESEVDDSLLQLGLFAYPVLQAADILLYDATEVPVGDDQDQHLELCRDLAISFNRHYQSKNNRDNEPIFQIPKAVHSPSPRILSLRPSPSPASASSSPPSTTPLPLPKMSKSSPNPNSRILLTDPPSLIKSKIKAAVTDSIEFVGPEYDSVGRPGVGNLLEILAGFGGEIERPTMTPESLALHYTNKTASQLKSDVTEVLIEGLRSFREEYERIRKEGGFLGEVERLGRERARKRADRTMRRVRRAVGFD